MFTLVSRLLDIPRRIQALCFVTTLLSLTTLYEGSVVNGIILPSTVKLAITTLNPMNWNELMSTCSSIKDTSSLIGGFFSPTFFIKCAELHLVHEIHREASRQGVIFS